MTNKLKILITGACGVTSRSVVRSLRMSTVFKDTSEFIGTDVCNNWHGIFEGLYDKIHKVPYYHDKEYRNIMNSIIMENKIDAAIILPDQEVHYWSENPFNVKFLRIPPRFAWIAFSKRRLYETLKGSGIIPHFQIIERNSILQGTDSIGLSYPFWMRNCSDGTSCGNGSFCPNNCEEMKAWLTINPHINTFMVSSYLPGRNFGCFLLYNNGKLLKQGLAWRMDYLLKKTTVSGITGVACKGKLLNSPETVAVARQAVESIFHKTGEIPNGLMSVDLKEDDSGTPLVTEINIRHLGFSSIFASAGCNFSEYQLLCALGRENEISPELEKIFPANNIMLRDVDGLPIYLEKCEELEMGKSYS